MDNQRKDLTQEEKEYLQNFVISFADPALMRALVMDVLPDETVSVNATYGVETAFHYFDKNLKEHKIYIGTNYDKLNDSLNSRDEIKQYVLALLIHELGHANFTNLDGKRINEICQAERIPFQLWNTAEDARIEIKMRQLIIDKIDVNYMFGWEKWLPNPEESADMSPEAILLTMINCENTRPVNAIRAKRVGQYYTRFVNAADSFEIIDILKEWRDEFYPPSMGVSNTMGKGTPGTTGMNGLEGSMEAMLNALQEADNQIAQALGNGEGLPIPGASGDASTALACLNGDIDIQALEQISVSVADAVKEHIEASEQFRCKGNFGDITIEEASNTDTIFKGTPRAYLDDEYKIVLKHFNKILSPSETYRAQRTPTRTLNIKSLGLTKSSPNTQNIYKRKEINKHEKGKRILFVLDLSGSMGGYAADSQRTIALAANELAKKTKYSIDLIGTKVIKGKSLHQAISLPVEEKNILAINANGSAEGIADAVTSSKKFFNSKDVVIFVTDGDIHDKEVNKKFFEKHIQAGTMSVGMYVGKSGHNEEMEKWFNFFINETRVSDAIEKLVHLVMHGKQKKDKKRIDSSAMRGNPKR